MMNRLSRYCIPGAFWLTLCFGALLPGLARDAACAEAAYTYDALNRLASVRYDNGKEIHYSYDATGNILTVEVTVPDAGTEAEAEAPE